MAIYYGNLVSDDCRETRGQNSRQAIASQWLRKLENACRGRMYNMEEMSGCHWRRKAEISPGHPHAVAAPENFKMLLIVVFRS